ncbi:MAG: DUF177 domain-containing protein [Ferruginibacter sp.]|nr:DUF177 domain-containing protein [Ferruginibacter sp.]
MGTKRMYEIAFVGLKPGEHEFEYELKGLFFKEKGLEEESKINANVKLTLDKNKGFMLLKFVTSGNAEVLCDRCGNGITVQLWDEFNVVVKLIANPDEMNEQETDPDVLYISLSESHIDVSDWLYEFVLLSIPTQHVCANDENGESLCNKEVLQKLNEMRSKNEEHQANSIWKGLEKFKEN